MIDQSRKSPIERILEGLNANTILLLAGFAALYYLSNVFVTKEIYYRDQVRLESTLKDIKDGQNRLLDLFTRKSDIHSN